MDSFRRADTSRTMESCAWSTSELVGGLEHLLTDGKNELPDDMAQLQEPPRVVVVHDWHVS